MPADGIQGSCPTSCEATPPLNPKGCPNVGYLLHPKPTFQTLFDPTPSFLRRKKGLTGGGFRSTLLSGLG
eukprot:CAMPEP_0167817488 /NCGR_PEP_ID=MMETSP0112_2-20121227/4229_1 /TAXON_ID=91324 /ORGANISM="Lotharella globosa, Strain CCCM811" /LENGTH=69 /DNA_ID=CAMNT_0007717271 /DNA_START=65 /DNA_END=271 /DNA_ORIENTATION=-